MLEKIRKLLLLGVTAGVLLPFWYAGSTGRGTPWLPWQIRELWAYSQLFAYPVPVWTSRHVQLLGADGLWHEVPQAPPFAHHLFGVQTRLDWLLVYLERPAETPSDRARLQQVHDHLCHTYAALYDGTALADERLPPAATPVKRARILRFDRPSSIGKPPPKRYDKALPGPLRPENHEVLVSCRVPSQRSPS